MKTLLTLLTSGAFLLLMTAGCGRAPAPATTPLAAGTAETRSFDTRGVVREIAADRRTAVIRHEEIPGYMPKMTMELKVRDPAELAGVNVGDEITFRLHATADTHWIDGIRRVGRASMVAAAETPLFVPEEAPELQPGDPMPDAEFLDEHGRTVRLSDFRGRAVAFTFFFTRCPLPDYCPRMNTYFRDARHLLLSRPETPTNWQFLCVSFDAAFDQPAVLARYARAYRGENPDRWLFAAAAPATLARLAPRLDLMVIREAGGFSHNLRTVVLDPAGRIFRQFDGNTWTPAELAEALATAARQSAAPDGTVEPERVPPQPTASTPARSPSAAGEWPRRLASPAIENLYQLGPGLFSGGEPRGEAAFAQLAALGVKTILSVDGAAPEVETARRHGLRYAHLPLGYQGYSDAAGARLARAIQTLPGPVFVHCHHGKHRGPAAAALMAMTALGWTPERAEQWLRTAGTSTNYPGLYETVRRWRPPAPAVLAQVPAEFPEVARTTDLTRAMVEVDRAWDHLKAIAAAGYRTPPDQPDLVPAREAARLAARLAESRQFPEVATAGAELLRHFDEAEAQARELSRLLSLNPLPIAALERQFQQVRQSCTGCHRAFRDRPGR